MAKRSAAKGAVRYLEPHTNKQYETQRRVLDALSDKRRNPKLGLTAAAKRMGTTVPTIRRYAAPALEIRGGRIDVKAVDRIPRRLRLLTPTGEVSVLVRNSRDASRISKHNIAVKEALYSFGADTEALERFAGKTLRAGGKTYTFASDYRTINRQLRAGAVHFQDIYVPGSSI
jgi:hypothetical protein